MAYLAREHIAVPIFMLLIIGLRLECILIDAMHTMELGAGNLIIANTLWESVRDHKWCPGSFEANCAAMDALNNQMNNFTNIEQI